MKKGKVPSTVPDRPAEGEGRELTPRKGLLVALGVIFVLWVGTLIAMRVMAGKGQ
jgi:hypothetical protein